MVESMRVYLHLPREDFIFIISPAISGKTQPDATWRTRHQLRSSKETMDNSLLCTASVSNRRRVSFYCGTSLKKVFHRVREGGAPQCRCRPEKEKEEEDDEVVVRERRGERRAKRNDEGGGPCYTTLVYFVVGTRQRCSTYTAHFATRLASGS